MSSITSLDTSAESGVRKPCREFPQKRDTWGKPKDPTDREGREQARTGKKSIGKGEMNLHEKKNIFFIDWLTDVQRLRKSPDLHTKMRQVNYAPCLEI
jgi:hypothetical protein